MAAAGIVAQPAAVIFFWHGLVDAQLSADEISEMPDDAVVALADSCATSILRGTRPFQLTLADVLVVEATELVHFLTSRLNGNEKPLADSK